MQNHESESSQDDASADRSKAKPRQKDTNKNHKQRNAAVLAIFGVLELLALVFWMLAADVFHNEETWVLHSIFMALAGPCFLLGAAHLMCNKVFRKQKQAIWVWALASLICLLFVLVVVARARPHTHESHLKLILNTRDSPTESLELTNDFLLWKPSKDGTNAGIIDTAVFRGRILIPASSSDPALRFKVVNDSGLPADNWFIKVMVSKKFEIAPWPGWERQDVSDVSVVDEKLNILTYFSKLGMLPGSSEWTPPITFKSPPLKQYASVIVTLRARDMPASVIGFSVSFWASTDLIQQGVITNRPLLGIRGASPAKNRQFEIHYPTELNRK